MPLQPLNQVLGAVQNSHIRQEQRRFQQLLEVWEDVVGPVVAAQTRPLTLQRGVLKVATSSAAWSQNLVFERQRILDKLHQVLPLKITDIRFSPAQWRNTQSTASFPGEHYQAELWRSHPSRLSNPEVKQPLPDQQTPANAVAAFQSWALVMQSRSRTLPLCPECHCPTPVGELERWHVCSLCAAKRW
ncbi:putative RNA-binding protein containing Zn ribbon [Leptolyngbyaceae cyanobacterium JSC-12]|nr:putative RNA-binding protein containing Zn ribbon [Leptolyngbyaceae cyanobacterium JSC-12]